MANNKKDNLFYPMDAALCEQNEAILLDAKVDILNIIKRMHGLKDIRDEEFVLKERLQKCLSTFSGRIDSLKKKMPEVSAAALAAEKKPKAELAPKPRAKAKKRPMTPEEREIENELLDVQKKLKSLKG